MFSIFFTDADVPDYDDARRPRTSTAFRAFFHAMLAHGVYLPPTAYEAWFVSTALDDAALEIIAAALPFAAQAARGGAVGEHVTTVVHVLRHGEVDNPTKILYGRLPGLPPLASRRADGQRGR